MTRSYVLDPTAFPFPGFALAADAAVRHLSRHVEMDLWLVTQIAGDEQRIVAAHGPWTELAGPGTSLSFPDSFCLRMLQGQGPGCAPDVQVVPAYAAAAVGMLAQVRCYIGVPLLRGDDEVFGTLCGFAGTVGTDKLHGALDLVRFAGSMLSTVLAREAFGLERSLEAAQAYALAEVDGLTGLRNDRGWRNALEAESGRCQRYGSAASILVVGLDGLAELTEQAGPDAGDAQLRRCAGFLRDLCRPSDVLARPGGEGFGVVAVECDALSARALLDRIRRGLRSAGIPASAGAATRRSGEDLEQTWQRAEEAMQAGLRRHRRLQEARAARRPPQQRRPGNA